MNVDALRKIGLSEGELKVYSTLLNSGAGSVNKVHEKTGIERRNIYDILNKLIERGLVTYIIENKKRLFQTTHPQKIIDYIEDKKSELEKTESEIMLDLPKLSKQFNLRVPEIYSEVYRGYEGIKAIWEDSLNFNAIYWIGAARYIPKALPAWFNNWNRKRIKLEIPIMNLLRDEMRSEIKEPWDLEQIKFLPKEFSGNPTVIGIHGPKLINYVYGEQPFGFMIQNNELSANYKRYFNYLWKHVAKK